MGLKKNEVNFKAMLSKFKLNKFTIAIILFAVWVGFFDKHNLISQYKLSSTINELQNEVVDYGKAYELAVEEQVDLDKNKEKYAREHHNFTGENEELFIIKGKE